MDDETLEKQLTLEWKDEDLSEQIEKEEKVTPPYSDREYFSTTHRTFLPILTCYLLHRLQVQCIW